MKARINHQEYDEIRERVKRIFVELTEQFETSWLYLKLVCVDGQHPTDAECAADTASRWEYRQANINVYLAAVVGHTDNDLRWILAHELIHAVVAPMESILKDTPEHTARGELAVESLTRVFLRIMGKDER